jgi:hypothetical protein
MLPNIYIRAVLQTRDLALGLRDDLYCLPLRQASPSNPSSGPSGQAHSAGGVGGGAHNVGGVGGGARPPILPDEPYYPVQVRGTRPPPLPSLPSVRGTYPSPLPSMPPLGSNAAFCCWHTHTHTQPSAAPPDAQEMAREHSRGFRLLTPKQIYEVRAWHVLWLLMIHGLGLNRS